MASLAKKSSTAQWLERPTTIGEVMGSNPVEDSDFFFFFILFFFSLVTNEHFIHIIVIHGVRSVMPVKYPVYSSRESFSSCSIDWSVDLDESEIMQYSNSNMLTLVLTPPVGEGFVWPSGTEKRMHGLSRPVYRLKMSRETWPRTLLSSHRYKVITPLVDHLRCSHYPSAWAFTDPVMQKFNFDNIPGWLVGLVTNEVSSPLELNDVSFLNWSHGRIS